MVRAGTNPSAPVSFSFTKRPARVTPLMRPSNVAPMRSARKFAISRSTGRAAAEPPPERRPDGVGQEIRDQPVDGFALSFHRAPLRARDARRDLVQRRHV